MKKFSKLVNEAIGNVYQIGTSFSNGHRSRTNGDGFLFDQHLMIDIDRVMCNPDGSIWAIIENKKQLPGSNSKLKNILTSNTVQKIALLELSKKLNCHFFVHVELDKTYHLIQSLTSVKTYTQENFEKTKVSRNYSDIETDNLLFVEFRYNGKYIDFKSISTRIPCESNIKKVSIKISQMIQVPYIEVDDSGVEIKFFSNGVLMGKVESVLNPKSIDSNLRTKIETDWESIYKKMGIF